jgi:putative DNA methylase
VTYRKKLIEVALPLGVINAESIREKSIRYGHPSTLHLWWARRPLASTRAVLWASLVDDPSSLPEQFPTSEDQAVERKRLFDILERLVPWEAAGDSRVLAEANAEIVKSCDGALPNILDPFGGGGAIPLESLRLGLPTFTGDLNPVAVLIQRSMLQIPSQFAGRPPVNSDARTGESLWEGTRGLAADVRAYGEWMRAAAQRKVGEYYPDATLAGERATVIAWIWARTVKSPDPSWPGKVPLVKSWVLAKKPGQPVSWIRPVVDATNHRIRYEIEVGGTPPPATISEGRGGGGATCLATGAPIPFELIREASRNGELGADLMAVVVDAGQGRSYISAPESHVEAAMVPRPEQNIDGDIFDIPGRIRVVRYGFTKWPDLFTARQLLALTTYADLLSDVRQVIETDAVSSGLSADHQPIRDGGGGATAYADAVITYLALGLSRLSDMCNALCRWESSRTQVRNLFGRPGIPMVWDFAENNVFNDAGGDYRTSLESVVRVLERLPATASANTEQRDARARIAEVGECVLCTDPPYYDNIHYADLSDFFYVWLRRSLKDVWPDEFATLSTPKIDELIAHQYRAGSRSAANTHFESGMEEVFHQAALHADPRFPATIFYAFKATESSDGGVTSTGWETFLNGLLNAGYAITATWPMRTELGNRMIASGSNALASSVVLACRPREISAPMATRGEFIGALRNEMEPAVRILQLENIAPVDLAQSAIGPGIAIFSRFAKVIEADGKDMTVRTALGLINEILSEVLSGEESEFDADTRFALTWYEQFGHNPGPFGDADLLARAKDTTVVGVCEAGVALSRDGKVRLLERSELPEGWDPAHDSRLTVWETVQHLVRAVGSSETEAAALLARLGQGLGERSRQLAYLLYGICDKKKWAEDATAYNMLVMAWPEISRLATATQSSNVVAEPLF